MPKPNAQRLTILTELRLVAGLTLAAMARRCGLRGNQSHQTAGAWERGEMVPNAGRRRMHFMGYLWDALGLRHDPDRFEAVWDVLVEEWLWEPISDREWAELTSQPRTKPVATSTPLLSLVMPPPFQAPAPISHFVGRAATLHQLTALLSAPEPPRTVALVGMGGIGKTTVATHAAHALRQHFRDGVLWAQTAISTPLDILHSWARAFGFDYSGLHDVESCAAALRSALVEKQLLFVLDDIGSVQRVRPLLIGGAQSAVLLTTRSEDVAAALNSQICALAELAASEGLQLLGKLLGQARIAQEQMDALAICDRLHHLPLAVEIVGQLLAARSRRPLAQMAQRLQEVQYRLDLQISDRDIRTSFLVSWEALDSAQQRVFAHLALFAGRSFSVQALATLLNEDIVLDQLDTLVARSLVKAVEGDRYRQHPLLADFAHEQLGGAPAAWQRYAKCQLAFARHQQTDYAALDPEWANVMAGMATAQRLEMWEVVLDYAAVLTEPWLARALYSQARQGYTWAVEAAQRLNNPTAVARYQTQLGFIWCELSDFAQALPSLQRALEAATQAQSEPLQADAQYHLARIALEQGDYEECDTLLSRCASIRATSQDQVGIAKTLHLRGILARRTGQYALAQQLGHQALQIQSTENDIPGLLGTYYLLTDCALATHNYALSERYCQQSLRILENHPRKAELAETYFSLAMTYRYTESTQNAWVYIERSRELAEHIGSRAFLAYIFYEQSRIKFQMGEVEQAVQVGLTSLTLMTELKDDFNRVVCLRFLGDLYEHRGEHAKAIELWQTSEQIAIELRHPEIHVLRERLAKGND